MAEIARGHRLNKKNPFRWNEVVFNIPGSKGYDPTKSWCHEAWREKEGLVMVNDFDVYVDDVRVCAISEKDCRRTLRRKMSVAQALGMQDASSKRRSLNRGGSPWAGSIT